MARLKTPSHVTRLLQALEKGLKDAGIGAEVESEPIRGTRLHRVYVVAPKFEALRPSERQSLVWRIAQDTLTREEQYLISMIMTVTPKELAGTSP